MCNNVVFYGGLVFLGTRNHVPLPLASSTTPTCKLLTPPWAPPHVLILGSFVALHLVHMWYKEITPQATSHVLQTCSYF